LGAGGREFESRHPDQSRQFLFERVCARELFTVFLTLPVKERTAARGD